MNLSNVKEGELKEVFDALEEAFNAVGVDFYLIGAIARDLWYAKGKKEPRRTKDVDFAALVGSKGDYGAVRAYLKEKKQFQDTQTNAFVLIAPSGIQVDILPFGDIEIDDGITLEGQGLTSIKVNGFKEVHAAGTETFTMETGHTFEVATLPAIVLLKLISFDDRPEQRLKDAGDIGNIIDHFEDLQNDLLYKDENFDLYTGEDPEVEAYSMKAISAVVIGREIRKIIDGNEHLQQRIVTMLTDKIAQKENSSFIREMSGETATNVEEIITWLNAIVKGLGSSVQ